MLLLEAGSRRGGAHGLLRRSFLASISSHSRFDPKP
jgi:hypothetical protein